MKTIKGVELPFLPISGLTRVSDLIYFDGPLLTHYAHPNGDDYLKYWCDCDETANRWMIIRINEASLVRLTNRFISLDSIIPQACRDDFVYLVDEASPKKQRLINLVKIDDLPEDYLPELNTYLDKPIAVSDRRSYSFAVEGGWSAKTLGEFPSVFSKAYSLLYNLNLKGITNLTSFPWRGGFSSMHFFNWLANIIPVEDRPTVAAMQYASPGFIRFNLNSAAADQVTTCIMEYMASKRVVDDAYSETTSYIRNNKLNDIDDRKDPEWVHHKATLLKLTRQLLEAFSSLDYDHFKQIPLRPFEKIKIARAFCRNIKELAQFDEDGLVKFPELERVEQS